MLAVAVLAAGCTQTTTSPTPTPTPQPTPKTITDMMGRTVTIPTHVNKVASLMPYYTQSMLILGAGDKIVVQTGQQPLYLKVNPRATNITTVSQTGPNIEDILKADPDIAFVGDNATGDKLAQNGVPAIYLSQTQTNFSELKQSFLQMGQILGDSELQRAKQFNAYLDLKLALINKTASTIPADQKVTVLNVCSLNPPTVDGNGTLIEEWVTTAGGINAAGKDVSGNKKVVSMEQVLKWDPDVITVMSASDRQAIMNDSQWKQIKAVRTGRVYVNPKGVHFWSRGGGEEALQIQWAAQTLYPDRFSFLDIRNETKSFYKTYFNYSLTDADVDSIMNATT